MTNPEKTIRPGCYRSDERGGCRERSFCGLGDQCMSAGQDRRRPLFLDIKEGKMPGGKPRDPGLNWQY